MMRTLAVMFEPAVGRSGSRLVMLAGSLSVLWSTYFVGIATRARQIVDFLQQVRLIERRAERARLVRCTACVLSLLPFVLVALRAEPRALALFSGLLQGLMMPLVVAYTIYLNRARVDSEVRHGWPAAVLLALATVLTTAVGLAALYFQVISLF